ncbi:MAG TPA: hypothetical protein VLM85_10545 [Polyangiaceae bacterium]|nr:hypothetical protein [Polyangiaceae bacterium]
MRSSIAFFTVAAIAVACSSNSNQTCTPGAQSACACPGSASGVQVCKTDGSGFDACQCGGVDGGVDASPGSDAGDAGDAGGDAGDASVPLCDPIAQTGCNTGEKCTWVRDTLSPTVTGELRCVQDGNVNSGGNCSYGASGSTTGYDNCKKGLICKAPLTESAAGSCVQICDVTATSNAPGACPANMACSTYSSYFVNNGSPTTGLCDATCNPLTQVRLTDNAPTCGGTINNGQPTLGCYGMPSQDTSPTTFTCTTAGLVANNSDVVCNQSNSCGPYTNGCAPGYLPLMNASTSSTDRICVALCEPDDTSLESHPNPGGKNGHTCGAAGAGGTHECRYWWMAEGSTTPISQWSDGLGYCMDYTKYMYDSNNDNIPDTVFPSCTTLSLTAHNFSSTISDAEYWGCISVTTRP